MCGPGNKSGCTPCLAFCAGINNGLVDCCKTFETLQYGTPVRLRFKVA